MDLYVAAERLMGMRSADWRRHANPWSVWTRIPTGPLLVLSAYSRAWLGWWCLLPVAVLLVWVIVNPRAFPPPARLDSWAARGVLGERLFLQRQRLAVPTEHRRAAAVTTAISLAGLPALAWGLAVLDPWATILGAALVVLGKMWFVDRMVWLHDDMTRLDPSAVAALHR
jgi:hypothetical protein